MKIKKLLVAAAIALLSILGLSTCAKSVLNTNNTASVSDTSAKKAESSSSASGASSDSSKKASSDNSKTSSDAESSSASASSSETVALTGALSQDDAIAKALADAGVAAEDANITSVSEETSEDGTKQVKVEFTSNGKEYNYTFDADSGEIVEKESDSEISETSETSESTAEATAKKLSAKDRDSIVAAAMAAAGVTAEDSEVLGVEQETEDGLNQVDIDFVNSGTRYHYILNAETQEVIETSTSPAE